MKRNKHGLSSTFLCSMDMGEIIPINLVEVLPGDTFQKATSALLRASPLLAPVMHKVNVDMFDFFVPHRLVWDDWEDFITGGEDGDDASVFPTITTPVSTGFAVGSLADYLGVTPGVASRAVSALPFRAYALIFNEWFRDQDLVNPLTIDTTSGADTTTSTAIKIASWPKDYFTSARPWEAKGPAITIPLGTTAPILGISVGNAASAANSGTTSTGVIASQDQAAGIPNWYSDTQDIRVRAQTTGVPNITTNRPQVFADLSSASAITLNALREAAALQRMQEARARYGSRYPEYLRYMGVRYSDARLQRPEFLGGGRDVIQFSEVLQTAPGSDPVGDLKGHGITGMRSRRWRRTFEEHGFLITLIVVRPKSIYADGLERHWNRRFKEDFWQPELQFIGQQAILNKEVDFSHATPEGVFGYQDRYDDYRSAWSRIAGDFRTTLDFWHFARIFGSDPALNETFINCVPSEEPFAVPSEDTLYLTANHSIQARRLVAPVGKSLLM